MTVLASDGLDGDVIARALIDAFLRAFVLTWPIWVIVGLLLVVPVLYRIVRWFVRRRQLARSGIADIDKFGGELFEQYLEVLFKRLGYKVERTRFVGDFGGDLVIRKDQVRTVVQAKRYSKAVGVKAVQEVVAAKGYYDCDACLVVSNRNYTKPAQGLAHKNKVELWDRDMLIRQLTATGAKNQLRADAKRDSARRDEQMAEPASSPPAPAQTTAVPLATVATCKQCAKVLTSGERSYCETNAKRFGGEMLCFRHQRRKRA